MRLPVAVSNMYVNITVALTKDGQTLARQQLGC